MTVSVIFSVIIFVTVIVLVTVIVSMRIAVSSTVIITVTTVSVDCRWSVNDSSEICDTRLVVQFTEHEVSTLIFE